MNIAEIGLGLPFSAALSSVLAQQRNKEIWSYESHQSDGGKIPIALSGYGGCGLVGELGGSGVSLVRIRSQVWQC